MNKFFLSFSCDFKYSDMKNTSYWQHIWRNCQCRTLISSGYPYFLSAGEWEFFQPRLFLHQRCIWFLKHRKSLKFDGDVCQLLEKRFLLYKCCSKKTSTCIWYDFVPSGSLLNCTFLLQWSHISYSASVSVPSTSAN